MSATDTAASRRRAFHRGKPPHEWTRLPERRPAMVYAALGDGWTSLDQLRLGLGVRDSNAVQSAAGVLLERRLIERGAGPSYRRAKINGQRPAAASVKRPRSEGPHAGARRASRKQRDEIARHGVEVPPHLTRAAASDLIAQLWRDKGEARRGKTS